MDFKRVLSENTFLFNSLSSSKGVLTVRKYTFCLMLCFVLTLTHSCNTKPKPQPFSIAKVAVLERSIRDYEDLKKGVDATVSQASILETVVSFFPSELHQTYKYDSPPEEIKSILVHLESANKYIEEARTVAKSESVNYEKTKTIRPEIIKNLIELVKKAHEESIKAETLLHGYKAK